jgi:hypothetical protein
VRAHLKLNKNVALGSWIDANDVKHGADSLCRIGDIFADGLLGPGGIDLLQIRIVLRSGRFKSRRKSATLYLNTPTWP